MDERRPEMLDLVFGRGQAPLAKFLGRHVGDEQVCA